MVKINLLRDKERGEIFFHGISSIIVNRSDQVSVQREIERMMGPTARRIVYKASKESSLNRFYLTYQKIKKQNKKISKKDILIKIFDELSMMGYGFFELESFNEKNLKFLVKVRNSFNTFGYETARKPVCHILSGVLASIFEIIFRKEMNCTEKKCFAVGHPERCEFEIFGNNKGEIPEIKVPEYLLMPKLREGKLKEFQVDYSGGRGEISYEGVNSMIISRDVYATEYRKFVNIIGPATKSLVYNAHKFEGIHALSTSKRLLIPLIRPFNKKLLAEKFVEEIMQRGYGIGKLVEFDGKRKFGKIVVKNSFNALGYGKKKSYPVCYFLIGVIAGGATLVFNRKDMMCFESKCVAKGDEHCEFIVKPTEE